MVLKDFPKAAAAYARLDKLVPNNADVLSDWADVVAATTGKVGLLIKRGKRYRETALSYKGGLRYPALRKTGQGETGLDRLLAPQTR